MIVRTIINWMICQNVIDEEDRELYEYAICNLFYSIAPMILLLFFGRIVGQVQYGIVLGIPLCLIRRYCGGYHAPKGWLCILISFVLLSFCFYSQRFIQCNFWLLGFVILAVVSLTILSPIESINRRLNRNEKKEYKKKTVLVSLFCTFFYFGLWARGEKDLACSMAIGIILAAMLQLPCIPHLWRNRGA